MKVIRSVRTNGNNSAHYVTNEGGTFVRGGGLYILLF